MPLRISIGVHSSIPALERSFSRIIRIERKGSVAGQFERRVVRARSIGHRTFGGAVTRLYSDLAEIYHAMYSAIFDYGREYRRFHRILRKYRCRQVLEIGCGSGSLARFFLAGGYEYSGMDIAPRMLRIARKEVPGACFVHADMRNFSARKKVDAVLISGRSFAYMMTNRDVQNSLHCIRKALKPRGILIFDSFDAHAIFKEFKRELVQKVTRGRKTFVRYSTNSMNLKTGWTWNWKAEYVVHDGTKSRTFRDFTVLRAFTRDELALFLALAGFTPLRTTKGSGTLLVLARKPRR